MELDAITTGMALAIFAAISIGAFFKGVTGVGLPLFAVPALTTITSVEDAVIIMVIPGIGANLALVITHRRFRDLLSEHRPFFVGGLIGGVVGTLFLAAVDDWWLRFILVVWLALYLVQYFLGNKLSFLFRARGKRASVIGAFAGTVQGATGISAHIVAPYFHDRSANPAAYALLVAFAFLVFAFSQSIAIVASPLLTETRLILGFAALVPTLIFTRVGISLSSRVSQKVFTNLLLLMFIAMEIKLIVDVVTSYK